jgi:hypothetical protein
MQKTKSLLTALSLGLIGAPALANDTSVTLGAGGLEIARTDVIEMKSEDLFISMDRVAVRYVFRNKSAADVKTLVAFPLPDLQSDLQESPLDIPVPDSSNFVGFKTKVDGQEIPLQVENKAIFKGQDRTANLAALGAPLNPLAPGFSDAIAKLPPASIAKLKADGFIDQDTIDQGKGEEPYYRPAWDLKTKFYREQTFPPGKDVVVEHEYRPVVGGTVAIILNSPYTDAAERARYQRDYCAGPKFRKAAKRFPENAQERWVSYILKTGANWAGPIADFKLTVDKGSPNNLVSFCGTGVTKISPTRFEMRARNFTPKQDLNFLFAIANPVQ